MQSNNKSISSIRLFRTSAHPCSYKKSEEAATVFVDPDLIIDKRLNSKLSNLGYRRSGAHLYRPDCDRCSECISCRVLVDDFRLSRSQRRIIKRNEVLSVVEQADLNSAAAFDLYCRYVDRRHQGGDMFPATDEQFEAFIKTKTVDTRFVSFYEDQRLIAVSVVDLLEQGLSAVYTFFEPDLPQRSLGNFIILWQINKCRELGLSYLYLGYWIKDCAKMDYKSKFRPMEFLIDGNWTSVV